MTLLFKVGFVHDENRLPCSSASERAYYQSSKWVDRSDFNVAMDLDFPSHTESSLIFVEVFIFQQKLIFSHRVELDHICVRCGDGLETLDHLLWDCQWSRDFWAYSSLRLVVEDSSISNFSTWAEGICRKQPMEHQVISAMLMWTNWFCKKSANLPE